MVAQVQIWNEDVKAWHEDALNHNPTLKTEMEAVWQQITDLGLVSFDETNGNATPTVAACDEVGRKPNNCKNFTVLLANLLSRSHWLSAVSSTQNYSFLNNLVNKYEPSDNLSFTADKKQFRKLASRLRKMEPTKRAYALVANLYGELLQFRNELLLKVVEERAEAKTETDVAKKADAEQRAREHFAVVEQIEKILVSIAEKNEREFGVREKAVRGTADGLRTDIGYLALNACRNAIAQHNQTHGENFKALIAESTVNTFRKEQRHINNDAEVKFQRQLRAELAAESQRKIGKAQQPPKEQQQTALFDSLNPGQQKRVLSYYAKTHGALQASVAPLQNKLAKLIQKQSDLARKVELWCEEYPEYRNAISKEQPPEGYQPYGKLALLDTKAAQNSHLPRKVKTWIHQLDQLVDSIAAEQRKFLAADVTAKTTLIRAANESIAPYYRVAHHVRLLFSPKGGRDRELENAYQQGYNQYQQALEAHVRNFIQLDPVAVALLNDRSYEDLNLHIAANLPGQVANELKPQFAYDHIIKPALDSLQRLAAIDRSTATSDARERATTLSAEMVGFEEKIIVGFEKLKADPGQAIAVVQADANLLRMGATGAFHRQFPSLVAGLKQQFHQVSAQIQPEDIFMQTPKLSLPEVADVLIGMLDDYLEDKKGVARSHRVDRVRDAKDLKRAIEHNVQGQKVDKVTLKDFQEQVKDSFTDLLKQNQQRNFFVRLFRPEFELLKTVRNIHTTLEKALSAPQHVVAARRL